MKIFFAVILTIYFTALLIRLWFQEKLFLRDGRIVREIEMFYPRKIIRHTEVDPATIVQCDEMRTSARSLGKQKKLILKSWVIVYHRNGREKRVSVAEAFDEPGCEAVRLIQQITAEKKAAAGSVQRTLSPDQ